MDRAIASFHLPPATSRTTDGWSILGRLEALRITALAPDRPDVEDPAAVGATLALAWDERGLIIEAEVQGTSWWEAADPAVGYTGTSIECFLRDPTQPQRHVQVVVMPGVALDQPVVRVQAFDHRPAAEASALGAITAMARTTRTPSGFVLQVRLPLSAIGLSARPGTCCLLRILVNHRRPGQERLRETWTGPSVTAEHPVVLDAAGSSGSTIATAGWMHRLDPDVVIGALVPSTAVGASVQVCAGNQLLAQALVVARHGRGLALLRLPAESLPARTPLAIVCQERILGMGELPELGALYRTQIRFALQHPLHPWFLPATTMRLFGLHGRFVFHGPTLPHLAVSTPTILRLAGARQVHIDVIDAQGTTVATAAMPGRYGAVATVTWEDGTTSSMTQTLVRLPDQNPQLAQGSLLERVLAMVTPGACPYWPYGLASASEPLAADLWSEGEAARMAAALLEGDAAVRRFDWQDRRWWHRARGLAGMPLRYGRVMRLPRGYATEPQRRYPLVLYLHGGSTTYTAIDGRPPGPLCAWLDRHGDMDVLACELQAEDWWDSLVLEDAVTALLQDYRIDPERIILTGFSMGGFGTWQAICDFPERYAAAIVIGGGPGIPWEAERCATVPLWVINGDADTAATVAEAEGMVTAIRAAGGHPRVTIQAALDHMPSLDASFGEPGLWEWALAQRRCVRDPLPPLVRQP